MMCLIWGCRDDVGELDAARCYLGSNVSYNVKKMVENGYLVQERSCMTAGRSMYG